MVDQERFMEALAGLVDYAQATGGVLSRQEIEGSFEGMDLNEKQVDMIYAYLFEKKIRVQGVLMSETGEDTEAKEEPRENGRQGREEAGEKAAARAESGQAESEEDSRYLQLYLEELAGLAPVTEGERLTLAMRLLAGEEEVFEELLNATLHEVVEIAKGYRGRGVYLEDLIQEGNIALMQVLKEMTGRRKQEEPLAYIREYVRYMIAAYIDEQSAGEDEEARIVAKLGLLHEAAKYMAKENGVLPDAKELADYTRLPLEEIEELVRLSKDVDFLGKDL